MRIIRTTTPPLSESRPRYSLIFGTALAFLFLILAVHLAPVPGQSVAVLTPPWSPSTQAAEVVAASGGRIVDGARFTHVILATSADSQFVSRLYDKGAILVFNPGIAAGCFTQSGRQNAGA